MTPDDLLKDLGLDAPPEEIDLPIGATPEDRQAAPTPSATALDLDQWSLRRGRDALAGDVLGPILSDADRGELVAADCLAAAFEPAPRLAEHPADPTAGRYFRELLQTEQFSQLHQTTQLDPLASELAAGHFAQGLLALQNRETPPPGDRSPGEGDSGADDFKADMAALGAAAEAMEKAKADVDDLDDTRRALGLGGDGANPGSVTPSAMRDYFARVRDDRTLRRIMELAGKYRRLAQARQRHKTRHGQDDMVGVTLGADLSRLCPSELAALCDDDLELDALRRYLERGLMQRDYRGVETVGRGPIVVIVDESGSMGGEPIAAAKALALAMGWIARHQRRWLCLIGFSGLCPMNTLIQPPGKWDQARLMDWLGHFWGGGSDRDVPLVELPEAWDSFGCPTGKTDIIQVTDAYCCVSDKMMQRFNAWKARVQARYLVLLIGNTEPGELARVADQTWTLPRLRVEDAAISEILSI